MKLWRPGITGKLFLAIFATCIVLLISMHWAVRISFERGFIDYIKRGNEQRLTMLSDALSEQYAQHGSWAFLRNNDRFIFQLLRTFERDNDDRSPPGHAMKPDAAPDGPPPDGPPDGPRPRPEMPPHGWRTMFWVVDQSGRVLVGPRERVPEDGTQRSIVVNGAEVGKVIASPVERLTRNTDINFDRQQKRTSWLIVALATLLAALATFPLARGLLAPVKRLVEGTHKLAAGDFSTRVTVTGGDELGRLAQDFNQLASTLERNQQMRRDLMADISHELRTRWRCCAASWRRFRTGSGALPPSRFLLCRPRWLPSPSWWTTSISCRCPTRGRWPTRKPHWISSPCWKWRRALFASASPAGS
ncbi:signal transduction histidine-protein kinase BaeS [Klebsiella pneumoniae]|nr:signal transduction histidine-protein kinase BaeS [Klebsiella pneumoniae]